MEQLLESPYLKDRSPDFINTLKLVIDSKNYSFFDIETANREIQHGYFRAWKGIIEIRIHDHDFDSNRSPLYSFYKAGFIYIEENLEDVRDAEENSAVLPLPRNDRELAFVKEILGQMIVSYNIREYPDRDWKMQDYLDSLKTNPETGV